MKQDVRDAVRALRAAPVVSLVAILSLALGIGANTAIFSIVNSLLLRTLPVHEPERLASLQQSADEFSSWTYPIWEQVRGRKALFAGAAAFSNQRFNIARRGATDFVEGLYVSGEFFDVLGVPAVLGRTFTGDDDRRGGGPDGPVAVISHAYWQNRFGGASDAIGRRMTLERVPFTIVGVAAPAFFGPTVGRTFDVAVPFGTEPLLSERSGLDERSFWWLQIVLRLKPDQTLTSATSALRGVQPQIREATLPEKWRPQDLGEYLKAPLTLVPAGGVSATRTRYARPMLTLLAVVALVLLIACANIANLMLARSTARRPEMAVRAALGASKARLARQLLVESLLVSAAGAAAGIVFARWAGDLLIRQMSTPTARLYLDLDLDWRVMGFTAAAAAGTAVLFGMVPAFRATRVRANEALKEQGRGIAGEGRFGFGNALVVAQIALSLMLVVAAGLFVGTFARLATLDVGFEQDRVLVASVNAQRSSVKTGERNDLFERLRAAAAAVPGAASAATSAVTPVGGMVIDHRINVPGAPDLPERERVAQVNSVSPDFFRTYGTRLLAGREFAATDRLGAPAVAIVNESFARKFFRGRNPVGQRVVREGSPLRAAVSHEIVGYAADAVYRNLRQPPPPTLYLALTQRGTEPFMSAGIQVSVRAAVGSPSLLTRSVADALSSVDPDLALTFRPLADQVRTSIAQERVIAILSGFFGALALLLAALGLYGVTSYTVGRRKAEIGIRIALGADPFRVVRMILRRVTTLVAAGVIVGTAASLWASRFIGTLLFGLEPRDPATLAGAALVLAAIGALSGWLPARRAASVDPAQVLREV